MNDQFTEEPASFAMTVLVWVTVGRGRGRLYDSS